MIVNPGIRRFLGSAIQRLFNGASFSAPLTHSAIPTRAASGTTATFTRATTKTVENNDGYLVTLLAGEIGFVGARRVRNLQATSSEPTSGWTAAGATPPTVTYTTLDGSGAVSMAFPVVAAGYANSRCSGPVTSVSWVQNSTKIATQMVVSLSRALTGSEALTLYLAGSSALDDVIVFNASNSPTSAVLQSVVDTFVNSTFSGTMGIVVYVSGAIVGSPVTLSLTRIQFEDVTAQTTQTAGEYVSVGVESAPYYHGSFVDGVKCFPTDLAGNALPTSYTYDAVSLNGVAGTYVSTPDSVAASVTGDIDIRAAFTTTSLTTDQVVISKTTAAAGNKSWVLYLNNAGKMQGIFYYDGTNIAVNFAASVTLASLGFSANSRIDVRATYQTSSSILTWYYSTDSGATWISMGASSFVGVAGIFDGNAPVELGTQFAGTSLPLSGKVYEAQIYNGIDGTLAVDFDASRYAGGTTLTGSTGETWTLQGNAVIHPTNNPMLGYQAEGARTNLCLQSNAFDNASWTANNTTVTANAAVAPDGTTTADYLKDAAGGPFAIYTYQTITRVASTAYIYSVYVKAADYSTIDVGLSDNVSGQIIVTANLATGVVTTAAAASGNWTSVTSGIVDAGNGWYRVYVAGTGGAGTTMLARVGRDVRSGSSTGDTAKGLYVWGAQVELGAFATSYIATTTAAVTRNADVLTYSSAGNVSTTSGAMYMETVVAINQVAPQLIVHDALANNYFSMDDGGSAAGALRTLVSSGGAITANFNTGSSSANTVVKRAMSWEVNSVDGCINGTLGVRDTSCAMPLSITTISVGGAGTPVGASTFRNIRAFGRKLSPSELQAVTS